MAQKRPKEFIQKKAEVAQAGLTSVYGRGKYGESPHAQPTTPPDINYFLVGLRGSGKSTLGKRVAKDLAESGRTFVDTDALVEAKAGATIAQIVADHGWDRFRELESEVLEEVCAQSNQVVATGGGMVLSPDNRKRMKACGKVFYLMAPLPVLIKRLEADAADEQRPPLTDKPLDEEMRDMLREREPLYMEVADFILGAQNPLDELAEDMAEKIALLAR